MEGYLQLILILKQLPGRLSRIKLYQRLNSLSVAALLAKQSCG